MITMLLVLRVEDPLMHLWGSKKYHRLGGTQLSESHRSYPEALAIATVLAGVCIPWTVWSLVWPGPSVSAPRAFGGSFRSVPRVCA